MGKPKSKPCPPCVAAAKERKANPPSFRQDPPRCAFARGRFRTNNWMCSTMLALREACEWRQRDDLSAGSIGVLAMPDDGVIPQGYLVLTWYKERVATPGAVILDSDGKRRELTLARARRVLEAQR